MKKAFFVLLSILVLALMTGCPSGDPGLGGNSTPSFITWNGNANGSWVAVANNDSVQFTTDGKMYYNGSTYSNITVNTDSKSDATVYLNGIAMASVVSASGTSNTTIAEMKCPDGSLVSIVQSGSTIATGCSGGGTSGTSTSSRTVSGINGCFGSVFSDTSLYGWAAFTNQCSQTVAVTYCNGNGTGVCGANNNLAPGAKENSGESMSYCQAHNNFIYFTCPVGYMPVNPNTLEYIRPSDTSYVCYK
jgi:hypothetical protein